MLPTNHLMSRRTFVAATAAAAATAWMASPRVAFAEETGVVDAMRLSAATSRIDVQPIRGNISLISGSGGNIAVLVGRDGKLMVDAGITASRPRIAEQLGALGRGSVTHVINTHWHFDHTDGNEWLNASGAAIIAHANGRKRMTASTRVEAWKHTFPPAPQGALPTTAVEGPLTLYVHGAQVRLEPYAPSHTDTDVRVTFTDADVVHVGDTWWNGHYPFIDYSTGGSIDGAIRAAEINVDLAGDQTLVVPGHGPVGGRRELAEFRDMLRTIRDAVAKLKQQGRSVDQVIGAEPTRPFDSKWGGFVIDPPTFTRLVYAGV